MGARIKLPTSGIHVFEMYRYAFEDDVEIHIGEDRYLLDRWEAEAWMRALGVKNPVKVLDWVWNFRRIQYDLGRQYLTIPRDQSNRFEREQPLPEELRFLSAME